MVALAIFTMAAVVLAASYLNVQNSYAAASRGLQEDPDVQFCRRQLLQITDLATAEAGLEWDTPDNPTDRTRHVKWTADIEPFAGSTTTAPTDLFTVTMTVMVTEPGGTTNQLVDTFTVLRPTWSDPTTRSETRQSNIQAIMKLQGRVQ